MEMHNEDSFIARGEVNQEKVDLLEKLEKSLDKFKIGAQTMASSLYLEMCEFPVAEKQNEFTIGIAENLPKDGVDGDTVWEDLESKLFYESIIDLANQVPIVLLGQKQVKKVEENIDLDFVEKQQDEEIIEPAKVNEAVVGEEEEETQEVVGTRAQKTSRSIISSSQTTPRFAPLLWPFVGHPRPIYARLDHPSCPRSPKIIPLPPIQKRTIVF